MINFRIKIRDFFKKYYLAILVVIGIWAIVFIINYILGHLPEKEFVPITTYEPHTSVMDSSSKVPERLQNPIEEKIKEFMEACNNKDYEKAYGLLTEECQKKVFENMENFQLYVDTVFDEKKIYNIQDFSNKDGNYIYEVTILEDIMTTGTTGLDSVDTYVESFVLKEENGEIKLSIRGYIGSNTIDKMYEDEYFKITIDSVDVEYEYVTYHVKIRNKIEGVIVFDNQTGENEIAIKTRGKYRKRSGMYLEPVVVGEGETKYYDFKFPRYYDESGQVDSLILNDIRVLKTYSGKEETRQEELDSAIARYGLELELN